MNCKKIILLLALILLTATTNVEAAENDSPFDILASTYTQGSTEALALAKLKTNGDFYFMIATQDGQAALVPYSRKIYDFYINKSSDGHYPPLIFLLTMFNQQRGQIDDKLGEWKDNIHAIPVYVLFNVENNQLQVNETIWSGEGTIKPSHFHSEIKNPNHIRFIKTFISHMPILHEQVDSKGIKLP